jgi:hypothetical protein
LIGRPQVIHRAASRTFFKAEQMITVENGLIEPRKLEIKRAEHGCPVAAFERYFALSCRFLRISFD